ncbi:MAG: hypothetical protein WC395_08430 [Bacteroidales bacterium]|jgi:hypothetical protein
MKKFLKWSAAFLVLGVLAVGCIKPEPSPGIEAMRNAKAALLNAQAALTQAKVQVEAANAALIMAQASLLKAEEAVIAAQAARIQAEADLIQAEVEWQNALTDFHKEAWAKEIEALEIELEVLRAEADAAIAEWELVIAQIQVEMVEATQAYEAALLAFEEWKIENAATLGQALIDALDALVFQIQGVILDLGIAELDLNYAKAQYHWYVNVEYPEDTSHAIQQMEANKRRLECEIEYLAGVVEAYDALYNEYHGDFDAMIAGFQDVITGLRAEIAELEEAYILLQEEALLFNVNALNAALNNLTKNRTVGITGVFSDGGDDPDVHVFNGNYRITAPWQATTKTTMFDMMKRDMRVIDDTRSEFEDQDSGTIEANIAAKKATADAAVKNYEDNWKLWQKYYDEARISGSHVGSRYVAWQTAWNNWNTDMVEYNAHLKTYGDMYEEAEDLIEEYMYYLNGIITVEDGLIVLPGATNISEVLGGIEFNAGNLADFIFGANGQAVIDLINVIAVMLDIPGQLDAIVTNLKAIMDGTHQEGWPAFWDHAQNWTYIDPPVVYGDIMRKVYDNSNRELTDMSKEEWSTWLFLYWLFQERTVEIGLEGAGTVITINEAGYTNAAEEVLEDFFGELTRTDYRDIMEGPDTDAIIIAIDDYYTAVEGLGNLEEDMFEPFNRVWKATKYLFNDKGVIIGTTDWSWDDALANVTEKPAIKWIYVTPSTYNPPVYDDDADWDETQPRPEDATEFHFVLEGPDGMGRTVITPSLDFDITYLNAYCDLFVSYEALLAAGEDCGTQWSDWAGNLPLWLWEERDDFGTGHYFYAIWQTRDYQAYQDTYNRVLNGEYAALIDKIQTLYDTQWALYVEAKAQWKALNDEYNAILDALDDIEAYIPMYETYIEYYQYFIDQAQWAHNGGNLAEEGLLEAWNRAKHNLIESQNELNRIEQALAIWEEGLGLPTFWGFIENETAWYQAQIDAILVEIENLQQQLIVLEGIRTGLLEDYL